MAHLSDALGVITLVSGEHLSLFEGDRLSMYGANVSVTISSPLNADAPSLHLIPWASIDRIVITDPRGLPAVAPKRVAA